MAILALIIIVSLIVSVCDAVEDHKMVLEREAVASTAFYEGR